MDSDIEPVIGLSLVLLWTWSCDTAVSSEWIHVGLTGVEPTYTLDVE